MLKATPKVLRAHPSFLVSPTNLHQRQSLARSQKLPIGHFSGVPVFSTPRTRNHTSRPVLRQPAQANTVEATTDNPPFTVIIAGAGIGGLVLAVALLKEGINVKVFERDLTAIRGEGKYRGPIQVQSNALAALEAIDVDVAEDVMRSGCITGDRINGLCDGVTGDWYIKFDTFHPAVDRGLPVTRVINRSTLQETLVKAVERLGPAGTITNNRGAVGFEQRVLENGRRVVDLKFEDGSAVTGDMLIGADGIWSKIRKNLIGETEASYSGYTCYTGISDFTPADIDIVGYRVFLGNGKYFVSSDVGGGKMQWYGFHKEPPGGKDVEGQSKARLLDIFGSWCDNVVDLIRATPEADVIRRDIFDRPPIFTWWKGRVALLGDSAHAMQPNLGQGGCMAIEDAFLLGAEVASAVRKASGVAERVPVESVLSDYQQQRLLRASTIHGMAGMAAIMASTYKAYLGEGLGPLSWLTDYRIPHPGRLSGQVVLKLSMPLVLSWVLGGNMSCLDSARLRSCRLEDKPKALDEALYARCMEDDSAVVEAAQCNWLLCTERPLPGSYDAVDMKGIYIGDDEAVVGSGPEGSCHLYVPGLNVAASHAKIYKVGFSYMLQDLGNESGTFVNSRRISANVATRLQPGDVVSFGQERGAEVYKVKLQHKSLRTSKLSGRDFTQLLVGRASDKECADARVPSLV